MINVGIVGCGDVATHSYMPGLASMADRARVVAVFDINEGRVNDAKQVFPEAAGYTDYAAFLSHDTERMDLVFNLTPAPLHHDITKRALEAGFSVYSEKPIASSMTDAQELITLADEKGLILFCAPAMAVTARMTWLKAFIESGKIGRPYFIKSHHAGMGPASWRTYSGDPRVFYTAQVGPLIDLGVYQLHAMTHLFGPATSVSSTGGIMNAERTLLQPRFFGEVTPVEAPDLYSINIEFADNRHAHLFNSFAMPATKSSMFELYASNGAVAIGSHQWYDSDGTTDIYYRDESESGAGEGWQDNVPLETTFGVADILGCGIRHALNVLENGETNLLTAAHAMHVLEIMLAAGRSIETGETIAIESTI